MTPPTDYTINVSIDYRNGIPVQARVDVCRFRGTQFAHTAISGSDIERRVSEWLAAQVGERPTEMGMTEARQTVLGEPL